MFDFGYDISNYHDVDPRFGTLAEFDRLVQEAEKRGIAIIMDMVLNHTSHLHPWFVESRSSRNNPKRDWYIWREGKKRRCIVPLNGLSRFPNNWMAAFGGHAWNWDVQTAQFYLHSFTEQQPDLNWRTEQVHKTMFDELRFWLDRGVKGFRLDVINYLVKDALFRNNPYRIRLTFPRRYELQHHIYDRNQPETLQIVQQIRQLVDTYGDTMLVGEVSPEEGIPSAELAAQFVGNGTDLLHMAFDFSTMSCSLCASDFRTILSRWYSALSQELLPWPSHVLSNHDQSRAATRLCQGDDRESQKKLLLLLLLTQRGTPFLYYGEEIGMEDVKIRRKDLQDPLGKKYYPFYPGRDPERTPMQWDTSLYAGFTTGIPWLPVHPDYVERNVACQQKNSESLLQWTKDVIRLRHEHLAILKGSITIQPPREHIKDDPVLVYERTMQEHDKITKRITVVLNMSKHSTLYTVPQKTVVLLSTHRVKGATLGREVHLAPYESTVLAIE
jgi:alpha-glucosidase